MTLILVPQEQRPLNTSLSVPTEQLVMLHTPMAVPICSTVSTERPVPVHTSWSSPFVLSVTSDGNREGAKNRVEKGQAWYQSGEYRFLAGHFHCWPLESDHSGAPPVKFH